MLITNELLHKFNEDSEDWDLWDYGEFDHKYGKYRTGGDLNLVQLYAVIKE